MTAPALDPVSGSIYLLAISLRALVIVGVCVAICCSATFADSVVLARCISTVMLMKRTEFAHDAAIRILAKVMCSVSTTL